MKTCKTIIALLAASVAVSAFAAGNEYSLTLDLARKNTAISLNWTEYCDNALVASVLRGGE